MTLLCTTVQNLGKQMQDVQNLGKLMQDRFAAERVRRQEEYKNMEENMSAKMAEGFRNEQQARQQAQIEILKGAQERRECQTVGSKRFSCHEGGD